MKQKITILVGAETLRLAKRTVAKERRPLNDLIQEALEQYLRKGTATPKERKKVESFDELPDNEKREVARATLRRALRFDTSPLTDEDLVTQAEELFLDLDKREASDG